MPPDDLGSEVVGGLSPDSLLRRFNRAGVLAAADVHVALALARLGGDPDEAVALAVALAVRAPRVGHVLADLANLQATVVVNARHGEDEDIDVGELPWPETGTWARLLARSPLVAAGDKAPGDRPLRLVGNALYLERYWRDECSVADDMVARVSAPTLAVDEELLADGLVRLFPGDPAGLQSRAAAVSARHLLSVVAGGPGTGKTTTVARLLALLEEQFAAIGGPAPRVALVAPTGKAAARMAEAVHDEARRLDITEHARARLLALEASTVHRLLGRHPGGLNRSRHDSTNRLPHDLVVVDETSMMSLPLMARLLEAVRSDARLVLVGDQEQLASVEAGAVLADIVGPATDSRRSPALPGTPVGQCITVLQVNHRFSGPLAELARSVRNGDGDAVMGTLASGLADIEATTGGTVRWLDVDLAELAGNLCDVPTLEPVRSAVVSAGNLLVEAAAAGDGPAALAALGRLRLLCAHRDGPAGASTWNARAEQWLATEAPTVVVGAGRGDWYVGRPVIVRENDYGLGLFNGDTGVTIRREDGGLTVAFQRGTAVVTFSPARLAAVDTAFAMTAHRAQGSEFDDVVVLLPGVSSRALTRELFYTAVTRARRSVTVVGTEASVRAAIDRPVARASGLTTRLWGESP